MDKIFSLKNMAVVSLIIGLIVGYQVNNMLISPRLDAVETELQEKNAEATSLQALLESQEEQLTSFQENLTEVSGRYEDLVENSVSREEYDDLSEAYDELTVELEEAETRVELVEELASDLMTEVQALSGDYQELLQKYNEIRVLSWTSYVVNGLRVNLTVTTNNYNTNLPVHGSISIRYLDGTPFIGTFKLSLLNQFRTSGKSSEFFPVNGEGDFVFDYPFISGTGTYFLRVSSIVDGMGEEAAGIGEVGSYEIQLTMG
ncbi:MAG: hypothetical protein NWE89_04825 [Candidatus Bathyarchaeota archaeon]|nr:hypothetical protein [Candidatus Bathyarchaeota archaeon]